MLVLPLTLWSSFQILLLRRWRINIQSHSLLVAAAWNWLNTFKAVNKFIQIFFLLPLK